MPKWKKKSNIKKWWEGKYGEQNYFSIQDAIKESFMKFSIILLIGSKEPPSNFMKFQWDSSGQKIFFLKIHFPILVRFRFFGSEVQGSFLHSTLWPKITRRALFDLKIPKETELLRRKATFLLKFLEFYS